MLKGIGDDLRTPLTQALPLSKLPCDAPLWWLQRHYREQPAQLRRALEAYGYYNASIEQTLQTGKTCWHVEVQISTGSQTRYRQVDIAFAQTLDDAALLARVNEQLPRQGGQFSHADYEDKKAALLGVLRDAGYLDAGLALSQVQVDTGTDSADVQWRVDYGTRYRVALQLGAQKALEEPLLQQHIGLQDGDLYSAEAIARAYRDLVESGYFEQVEVTPLFSQRKDGAVPVAVQLTAASSYRAALGAGFATDSGPRARLDLRWRRINRAGHRARLDTLWSPVAGHINGEYRIPRAADPLNSWYALTSGYEYSEPDTFDSERFNLGVQRSRRHRSSWIQSDYINYSEDSWQIAEQSGNSQLLLIGNGWLWRDVVDTARPRQGRSFNVDWRLATRALASDTDVLQANFAWKEIVPLGDNWRLLSRLAAGWNLQQQFDELPRSLRYFAGGDNSVRGYGLDEIGEVENGEVIGGRGLLEASLEVDVAVAKAWSLALFADSGSAFDSQPDMHTGVGVGVRWYSPVGPLRFDIAHPLDDPGRSLRLHISLGADL